MLISSRCNGSKLKHWNLGNGAIISIHQPKAAQTYGLSASSDVKPISMDTTWVDTTDTTMKGPKEPPFWSTKLHCGVMDSHPAVTLGPTWLCRLHPCLRQTSHDAKGIHYLQGCKVASRDLRWCQRNSYVWTWRVSCSTSPNLRFQIRKLQKNNCDIGSFKTTRL